MLVTYLPREVIKSWDCVVKIKSLPSKRILNSTILKAYADNKIKVSQKRIFFDRVGKIVGKGVNTGYHHFHLFPHCFSKRFFFFVVRGGSVCKTYNCLRKS